MKSIVKLFAIVGISIKQKLIYRGATWFGLISSFISVVIFYFLWEALYSQTTYFQNYDFPMMVTYVVLSRVLACQFSQGVNATMADLIHEGNIAVELLRPLSFIKLMFAQKLGEFFQTLLLRVVPIVLVAGMIFKMLPPVSLGYLLLFIICVLLSVVLLFFVEFSVGLIAFYTLDYFGVIFAKDALLTILSGGIAPLFFFPQGFRTLLDLLPFKYLVYTPINIYLGTIGLDQALQTIALEVVWIIILGLLSLLFYSIAIKKVVVQGG